MDEDQRNSNSPNMPMMDGAPPDTAAATTRHMNPDPGDAFRRAFPAALRALIVAKTKYAYDIVKEKHDPSLGYDAFTFGYNVYRIGCFQIGTACERSSDQLSRVEDLRMLVRFQTGEFTFGFYKVGNSENEDIWESFPASENGATSATSGGQIILPELEEDMTDHVADLRYAVVAHVGSAERGLRAIYLCIPVKTDSGKIVRWGYVEELYVAHRATGAAGPAPVTLPAEEAAQALVAAEEPEADFEVRPKDVG